MALEDAMLFVSAAAVIVVLAIVLLVRVFQRRYEQRAHLILRHLAIYPHVSAYHLAKHSPKLFPERVIASKILQDLKQEGFLKSHEEVREVGDRPELPRIYYSLTDKGRSFADTI